MPLSHNPERRKAQLANLRRGHTSTPANQHARSHGGYGAVAVERLDAKAAELMTALGSDLPLRDADGGVPRPDHALVSLAARAMCQLESVEGYLAAHGYLTDDGEERPASALAGRLRREVAGYLDLLGMSPKSRAALGVDLARAELGAAEAAEAREARERLDRRLADLDGDAEEVTDGT